MLTPEMIWEDIRTGDDFRSKGDYYNAYRLYCCAETAFDREEEAMCLIGDPYDFEKATSAASLRRQRVWELLTADEQQGVSGMLDEYRGFIKK